MVCGPRLEMTPFAPQVPRRPTGLWEPRLRGAAVATEAFKATGTAIVAEATGATVTVEAATTTPSSAAIGKALLAHLPESANRPVTGVAFNQAAETG